MVVLWKDHTGHAEAAEITALAAKIRPHYLAKCGGTYSAEWFWAKILHSIRVRPDLYERTYTWVEHADWLPAVLCGRTAPSEIVRGICAAGHKAMFGDAWGGYPDEEFLAALDPRLVKVRKTLPDRAHAVGELAGTLCPEWAELTGLSVGIPVSVGAFDAHLGAVGSGITEGSLVKIIGTSTCDVAVAPLSRSLPDIPGLCGIVPNSVLPGHYGLEAGQSAVGDIFNWYVNVQRPGNAGHAELTEEARALKPGQSGLLALDWHNGNRTVLVDQRLTGGVIGLTLHTTPAELYRAWIEATAFGARAIAERFEEYDQKIERVINCGGIAAKNPMVMQIYADIMGKPIEIPSSSQTCALGAAMSGAVAGGAHPDFASATAAMTSIQPRKFTPISENRAVYDKLYRLYKQLHDAFGIAGSAASLSNVMKDLLAIRDEVRSA
jgi:L-ribulokinase